MVNHGPKSYDPEDDYPAFCINAAKAVVEDQRAGVDALGIVLGGSGNGEQIAANKVEGIRAALAWNLDTAKLAREHNNANVIAVGGRQHTDEEAAELIEAFLAEPFSEAERHRRRNRQIATSEATGKVTDLPANLTMSLAGKWLPLLRPRAGSLRMPSGSMDTTLSMPSPRASSSSAAFPMTCTCECIWGFTAPSALEETSTLRAHHPLVLL